MGENPHPKHKNRKMSHNSYKGMVGYEKTERLDAKKPCAVYYDAGDLDGADGVAVGELFTQNHRCTLPLGAVGVDRNAGRCADIAYL